MANTRPNIRIQSGAWIDVYSKSGLPIGTQLFIENVGDSDLFLAVSLTQPDPDHDSYNVLSRKGDGILMNNDNDSGVWVFSNNQDGKINVSSTKEPSGFNPAKYACLHDGFGNPIGSLKGAIDVHVADVHNIPVNDFFHRHTDTQTTLLTANVSGDTQLDVDDTTGFVVGDLLHLGPTTVYVEPRHPVVTSIPDINTIVLDGPIHTVFPIGASVIKAIANLASQDGTLAAPISYKYFTGENRVEHITRILISMTHDSAGADDLFGGIAALLNGIHFRSSISGQLGTFTNWKTNSDIKLDMFDVDYSVKSGPGDFGTNGRGSFSRIGVVVRLDAAQDDFLELLVQDTMLATGLSDLRIKVQGHVEGQ